MKKSNQNFWPAILVTAIITTTGSYLYFNHQYQINKSTVSPELEKVSELYNKITTNYVGQVQSDTLIEGALKGMTEAIGDPYSVYLEKEDAKNLEDSLASSITGIGATMTMVDGKPQVASPPLKGTPADKAGIKKGDIITKVDGKDLTDLTLDEVVQMVRGKEGSKVKLEILSGETKKELEITRAKVAVESIQSKMETSKTGYLKIQTFSENTAAEFKDKVSALRQQGATDFIIDVRQNPGGLLDQVVSLSSMLLEEGQTIVKWSNKQGQQYESKASKKDALNFKVEEPLTILVDSSSASAAEILAGAVKDNKRGKIIGQQTFGKGTMQDVGGEDQDKLKLTTGKWFTPNGTSVDGKGLAPDFPTDYPKYAYLPPLNSNLAFKKGDKNEAITVIKIMMEGLGYTLEETPDFDETLENALKDFQEKNQIEVTGKWEENTSKAIQEKLYAGLKEQDPFINKALEILGDKDE